MLRKIDAMRSEYGANYGVRCRDCCNFERMGRYDKTYRKCIAYGDSCSEATDWNANFEGCGLFNKPFDAEKRRPLVEVLKSRSRGRDFEIDEGQIRL